MTDEINRVAETSEEIVQLLATVREGDQLVFTYRNEQKAHVEAVMDSYLPGYDTEPAAERDMLLWFRDVERDTEGCPPYGKVYYSAPREPALKPHLSIYGYTEEPSNTEGLRSYGAPVSFKRRLSRVAYEPISADVSSDEKTDE